eukprot:TRINITY_DN61972_c0_g1_i1.p3 TRINITY_DN61972_c0_g1~~TRINITY_DN61972_c0_g1_i1.p3  ORF type:complete len:103 (-),score=1.65 TRINITY_DN61972_c0_g1_i1:118-426(-)
MAPTIALLESWYAQQGKTMPEPQPGANFGGLPQGPLAQGPISTQLLPEQQARLQKLGGVPPSDGRLASLGATPVSGGTGFCTKCGTARRSDDPFCGNCGNRI